MYGPATRELGDEQLASVADHVGIDVLERGRIDVDARHVHAALVRERVAPDVGLVGIGGEVEQLVEEVRGRGQRAQLLVGHALVAELELEVRDDRDQVGVSAPLPVAVHRALDVDRALLDRGERARDAAAGVVVAVDPDAHARRLEPDHDRADRRGDVVGQRAAVGVAADDRVRARLGRGDNAADRVPRVVGEPVEEVLGVVDDALALVDQERDRLGDHPQVLLAVDLDHLLEVQAPRLADDRAHRRARAGELAQARIRVGLGVAPARHPERGDLGVVERLPGQQAEQLELLGVRGREAGFDQVDPELVEAMGHPQLLFCGQRHPLPLHAVAEGGVVELDMSHAVRVGTATTSSHSR